MHRHVVGKKRCLELSDSVCLTQTTDGYLVHFEPSWHGARQVGGITVGRGAWEQTAGAFETGDLTIKPSIRISTTRDGKPVELIHGFVRNGRWVPA